MRFSEFDELSKPMASPASESSFISSSETVIRMTWKSTQQYDCGFGLRFNYGSYQKLCVHRIGGKKFSKNYDQGCGLANYLASSNIWGKLITGKDGKQTI